MRKMKVDSKSVGEGCPVFVIAEAGINHGGDLKRAIRMVESAARSGADAIKFQSYVTEKRVPTNSQIFELLKGCELDDKAHWELQGFCRDNDITFISTAFDEESVALLADMNVPAIKTASFDVVNLQLLRSIVATRIPVIMSTGMAEMKEVAGGAGLFEKEGIPYALLHCISAYPAEESDMNLRAIASLRERFHCPAGFSDHSIGNRAAVYSVLAGAELIEKHFTLDKDQDGPDHKLSVDPSELEEMMRSIREAEVMLGSGEVALHPSERETVQYRRPSD